MNIELKNLDNLTEDERKTFNKLVEKINEKPKVFTPKLDQDYYAVMGGNVISYTCNQWDIDNYLKYLVEIGNCFETREKAEFALEKQKVYMELKRYALEHNEDVFDWRDGYQRKYYIYCECEKLGVSYTEYLRFPSNIYFTSEEIAESAIIKIGEEKIKKYLFEVENND